MRNKYKKPATQENSSKKNSWKAIAGTRTAATQVSKCERLCVCIFYPYSVSVCVCATGLAVCDLKSKCVQDDFVKDCKAVCWAAQLLSLCWKCKYKWIREIMKIIWKMLHARINENVAGNTNNLYASLGEMQLRFLIAMTVCMLQIV